MSIDIEAEVKFVKGQFEATAERIDGLIKTLGTVDGRLKAIENHLSDSDMSLDAVHQEQQRQGHILDALARHLGVPVQSRSPKLLPRPSPRVLHTKRK